VTGPVSLASIRGDLPDAASLATVWQALRDSLEEILRRARAARETQADQENKRLTGSD
jgi:hypothetical protein